MNWQISKVKGTKEAAANAIGDDAKLPQIAKDFIRQEIASLPADVTMVVVTGYSSDHDNSHGSKTRNIQLTISTL